ncbi:hypothetical protein [Mycobacterium sp.]|uniref:hypothetical protein n=1 Tax=Mycobacterium sp. TaxID=1785 RepID=UPI002605276E|nr:hypothetical protein [Mycobacterium sp.]
MYVDLPIAAGLAKVPFDFGMFGLGGWKANESTVHEPVTGLHLTGRYVANGGRRILEDFADVAITNRDARKNGQTPW